ncbi:hypothetical protein EZS27_014054 [termite gut metagenome]|uniref:Uncharacterized protein n=1 Tax=termite gut metagenome TaxID=433724 RepID=A0A5J4RY28_9ZZZZ
MGSKKVAIPDKVSIEQRPESINLQQRFGDWEIDTIAGKENDGAIVTLTERKTGFLLIKKLSKGKNAKALAKELEINIEFASKIKDFFHMFHVQSRFIYIFQRNDVSIEKRHIVPIPLKGSFDIDEMKPYFRVKRLRGSWHK